MLKTKEHYDLLDAFERNHRDLRLDRENRALWAKGRIYQSGEANSLFLAFRNGYALGKVICREDAGDHTPSTVTPAEVGGLVDTLRSMSHDDNTRACVSVNSTVSNDLAKKLFDVLHAAPKAATALEAQAAELAVVHQRYVDADEARIDAEAQLAEARKALEPFAALADIFDHHGGNRPREGVIAQWSDHRVGDRDITVEHLRAARRVREGGKVDG